MTYTNQLLTYNISRLWMDGSFEDLDAPTVEAVTDDFYKEIQKIQKVYKAKIKAQIQENVARRFKGLHLLKN